MGYERITKKDEKKENEKQENTKVEDEKIEDLEGLLDDLLWFLTNKYRLINFLICYFRHYSKFLSRISI